MAKYTIGIDFGTLSARAILVDVKTGAECPESGVFEYPHAVMETELPSGKKLPYDYALQHPQDYLDAISFVVPEVLKSNNVSPDDVIGLGIDFTACTVFPIDADGTPLCLTEKYNDNPLAYVQLWKHHGAQEEANQLTATAAIRGETFLARYGGKASSETLFPRLWKIAKDDPKLYADMDQYVEAGDWIVGQITGNYVRNSCAAGYKALYHEREGYPSKEFFKALDPGLENVIEEKIAKSPVQAIGTKAGEINAAGSKLMGLNEGTAVAVAMIDAHAGVPGTLKEAAENQMVLIMGTSGCQMSICKDEHIVPGCFGVVKDGMLPGFYGYECGQSGFGDHYAWFVDNCVPEKYAIAAREQGKDLHQYLTELADKLVPGESGLLALDWWNGNRSILVDNDLTGLMMGLRLTTRPEEIYRALIEATAFGTRVIIDNLDRSGCPTDAIFATGGIALKNPMLMQIFADITNRPFKIAGSKYGASLGSAVMGALAAGTERGGYDNIFDATAVMANLTDIEYQPIPENVAVYDKLYEQFLKLHDYFGRDGSDAMKVLKQIQLDAIAAKGE